MLKLAKDKTRHIYVYILAGLISLTFFFGFILFSARVYGGVVTQKPGIPIDDISITVPVSCNLSSGATTDVAHTAIINNGTYQENIGTTTFQILCNDDNGFSVYAIGYSNEELGNTNMIATVNGSLVPSFNIPTGLATAGGTSAWAMKLTPVEGTYKPTILSDTNGSFADYHVIPTIYTKVATLASNTDFTNGSSFTTTYRAYVSPEQPAGSYVGKVRYVIVHPASEVPVNAPINCPAEKICYSPNAEGVVDTMADQTPEAGLNQEEAYAGIFKYVNQYLAPTCFNDGYIALTGNDPTVRCVESSKITLKNQLSTPLTYQELGACFSDADAGIAITQPGVYYCADASQISASDIKSIAGGLSAPCLGDGIEFNGVCIYGVAPSFGKTQLWASNFKRQGYGFAGWRDEVGDRFGPNEIIDLSSRDLSSEGLSLYAIWVPSAGNLQNWAGCNSLASGAVTALTDTRDNNAYAVAKLADGNCWMIENMRLGSTATTTLTPTDSNVASNFTLSASTNPTTTAWCEDLNATCIDQSMLNSDNTTNSVANMTTPDANIYSYSNYYNWYSATAGTGTYSMTSGNALSSICPIGWRLPAYAEANTDFYKLASTISGKTLDLANNKKYWTDADAETVRFALQSYPNNFIASGFVGGSAFYDRGNDGSYWSASAYGAADYAYGLDFYPGYVFPGTFVGNKHGGLAVRCMFGSAFPSVAP